MAQKTVFFCSGCGNETLKWMGQCPSCGSWNTIVEEKLTVSPSSKKKVGKSAQSPTGRKAVPIHDVAVSDIMRFKTGMDELDRVLGGGAVKGELILVGGEPGIGKSTLLLQICDNLGGFSKVLYVTGEESEEQLKLRAERLGIKGESTYVFSETRLDEVMDTISILEPDILIIDSIQTLYSTELTASPGSVSQVKECTAELMRLAKGSGITIFIIGHVNKEGAIAGPKVLEHMVDCVLQFEGDRNASYRILRAVKNRFGSISEIGVFEMLGSGLAEVPSPSEALLTGRPVNTAGTCVTCVIEGTRPILAEVQALVAASTFNVPRRTSNGVDYNRAVLLMAVLEKRGGIKLSGCDVYLNVIGGLILDEPSADLAAILSIASSYFDKPIGDNVVAIGEVGLTGELRSVSSLNQRLAEAVRLGFTTCILPRQGMEKAIIPKGMKLIPIRDISEALVEFKNL